MPCIWETWGHELNPAAAELPLAAVPCPRGALAQPLPRAPQQLW